MQSIQQRCRARHNITCHQGLVKAQTTGTIQYETDNLGRHLIKVLWDNSFEMYVFPNEIELLVDESESSEPSAILHSNSNQRSGHGRQAA